MKKHKKSIISMGIAFLLALGSTGCFSIMVMEAPIPDTHHPVLQDSIMAIGQPDEASLKKIGIPHALVFLGDQKTYLLVEGGEELMQITKGLDGKNIKLHPDARSMFLKDQQIWGSLSLSYSKDNNEVLSAEELSQISKLGFNKQPGNNTEYEKRVRVKGMVFPKLTIESGQLNKFKIHRTITFYNPPSSAVVPTMKKIALTPVAVAADVATAPIQILGVAFLFFLFRDYH